MDGYEIRYHADDLHVTEYLEEYGQYTALWEATEVQTHQFSSFWERANIPITFLKCVCVYHQQIGLNFKGETSKAQYRSIALCGAETWTRVERQA